MLAMYVKKQWFGNVRGDLVAGLVTALALIPETIAFSIIAGVDPKVGLYASFIISVVIAFVGGRPGMISGAAGAMALVMVTFVRDHGLEYLLAATVLTGVLQILFGAFKLGRYLRFVSRSVMVGFVNSLAILIFVSQLGVFAGAGWHTYALVALGMLIVWLFPRVTKAIPSPLIAVIAITLIAVFGGLEVRTIGDMGALPESLPVFAMLSVPLTLETLGIVLPLAATLALVGLLESLLTAQLVDQQTGTPSNKNMEAAGQGIANIVTGFFGGMAGCAMIGQAVINIQSGGRGRLSSFMAGVYLMVLMLVLAGWVKQIPMAALAAVMMMVALRTFDWASLKRIRSEPKSDTIVLVVTVAAVVITNNLAIGVVIGIILSALFFARKVSKLFRVSSHLEGTTRVYQVAGELFFVSTSEFLGAFDFTEDGIERVVINLSRSHVWDNSGAGALREAVEKFTVPVELVGVNEESERLLSRTA